MGFDKRTATGAIRHQLSRFSSRRTLGILASPVSARLRNGSAATRVALYSMASYMPCRQGDTSGHGDTRTGPRSWYRSLSQDACVGLHGVSLAMMWVANFGPCRRWAIKSSPPTRPVEWGPQLKSGTTSSRSVL